MVSVVSFSEKVLSKKNSYSSMNLVMPSTFNFGIKTLILGLETETQSRVP